MSDALSVDESLRLQNTLTNNHGNTCKLVLMKALEHLYIARKYRELELFNNCGNCKAEKCSTISKQFESAIAVSHKVSDDKNVERRLLTSHCSNTYSSSSSRECSKRNDNKILMEENIESLESHGENLFHTNKNNKNMVIWKSRKFKQNNNKKKYWNKEIDISSSKVDMLKELKRPSCKESRQEVDDENSTNSMTNPEEKEISNYFTQVNNTFESNSIREVIFKFRESASQYWVIDINNVTEYHKIEILLNTECEKYKNIENPEKNFVYGCLYENKWYRGKVISLLPNVIHFIDFGKTCLYKSEFKKIPEDLMKMPGLVYQVFFKENTPECYLSENLEKRKLMVKISRKSSSGIPVVEIVKNSEFLINNAEEKEIGETLKNNTVTKLATLASTTDVEQKYVIDTITGKSKGIILLTPGRRNIRFGSIFPENDGDSKSCSEKITNLNSSNLIPMEANEGEYVLVHDIEKNNQRGKVLCKLGSTYYILLIDCGVIMSTDEVYSLAENLKMHKGLGVVITLQEVFSEEVKKAEIEVCNYSVIEEKEKGKWKCKLLSPGQKKDNYLANVIIERPTQQGINRLLKCGCSVKMSATIHLNNLYVRELDKTSEWYLTELNKKINIYCESAPNLTSTPRVGDLCCAKFADDQKFYRGLVKSVENDKAEVLFVDFGNSQFFDICSNSPIINVKDVKKLPPGYEAVPFFAVKVELADLWYKESYSPKVKQYLQKLILENTELILTYRNSLQLGVYLQEKLTGNFVNDILNQDCSEIVGTSLSEKDKFFGESMEYSTFCVGTKCKMAFLYVSDKEFKENYTFWCCDASTDTFRYIHTELGCKISAYCNSCSDPYRPSKQELCLAQFEEVWYRALTLDADGDNFIVFFPDFGNMCEVTSKSLRKIEKEFIAPPALAVNCTINDPGRLKGKPELSKKVFEVLENLMNKCVSDVEICSFENETFYLRIPEIEAIIASH